MTWRYALMSRAASGSSVHPHRAVRFGGASSFQAKHADFINNTADMNGGKVGYADIFAGESTDIRLMNSVVYSRVGGKANTNDGNTDVRYDYNLYFNGTREATGAHDVLADPKFANAGIDPRSADSRLMPGSPAIDTTTVLAGVN